MSINERMKICAPQNFSMYEDVCSSSTRWESGFTAAGYLVSAAATFVVPFYVYKHHRRKRESEILNGSVKLLDAGEMQDAESTEEVRESKSETTIREALVKLRILFYHNPNGAQSGTASEVKCISPA